MSRWNDCTYYIIPKDELNEDIISVFAGSPDNVDSLRYSIRLVSPELIYNIPKNKTSKFCCVGDLHPNHPKSAAFQEYRPYSHEQIYHMVRTADWDIGMLFKDVLQKYDFEKVSADFKGGYLLQAIGELHIAVYSLLKTMFFLFSKEHLNSQEKWKLFQGSKSMEGANESTILELNYFYDLITKNEMDQLEKFRLIRNDIVHDKKKHLGKYDLDEILHIVDDILIKYFIKYAIVCVDETHLFEKLKFSIKPNLTLLNALKNYLIKTEGVEITQVPEKSTWIDLAINNQGKTTFFRLLNMSLLPYDFLPRIEEIHRIMGTMTKADQNVILFACNDIRSYNYLTKNLMSTDKFNEFNLSGNGFRVDSCSFNSSGTEIIDYSQNILQ